MELTRFQKIMLAVLAGMLALFSVLMAVFRAHPGVHARGRPNRLQRQGPRGPGQDRRHLAHEF